MSKRAGHVLRLATPLKAWAQRFALFLLVGATFGLMMLGKADTLLIERARVAVTDAVAPILDAASRPVSSFNDALENAKELATVREQNAALRQQVAELSHWQQEARTFQSENGVLRKLLNLAPEAGSSSITARVIGDQSGVFRRSVLIGAGLDDGVRKGQPALTGDGLAGRVAEVGEHSARILLITDLNSRIPVFVGEARDRAILAGDNSSMAGLQYLAPGVHPQVGARVVTSGQGGVFPPGLPVGVVSASGEQGIQVRPFVDWEHLEFLRLIDYELRGLLKSDGRVLSEDGNQSSAITN
ncbi:MAG: rod shape-determining protein MreC [Rhodovibrionaceae bacterium]